MSRLIEGVLRCLALLWTLLITALIGNVIANNIYGSGPANSAIYFTMFVAAWSWVTLLFGLAAVVISSLALPVVLLPLDILAVLFTFIAAVVLSAKLGVPNCGNIHNEGMRWIAFGSSNNAHRCREIQASTVFMWFLWATFLGCLFFSFRLWRGGSMSRSSRPSMSQVYA